MGKYLDSSGITHLWSKIKTYVAGLGYYTMPSTGIPASDIASGVIPIVPTNLSSFTDDLGNSPTHTHSQYLTSETEPDFNGSAAATITSSDISSWNGKTSNVGTITGITMNGASKGTSGVVDLGTVITEHQSLTNYVQKSQTSGLLKNDGTVDTNSYALSSSIPTVPSNIVTGLNSSGVATAYTIQVVASLPPTTESNTIYLIPE